MTWVEEAQWIHHQHLTSRVQVTHEILGTGKLESLLGIYSRHKVELDLLPLTGSKGARGLNSKRVLGQEKAWPSINRLAMEASLPLPEHQRPWTHLLLHFIVTEDPHLHPQVKGLSQKILPTYYHPNDCTNQLKGNEKWLLSHIQTTPAFLITDHTRKTELLLFCLY